MRVLSIEVREDEIEAMVSAGLLRAEHRDDRHAVTAALYSFMDRAFEALNEGRLPK
jgi:hypothetical protein